MQFLRDYYPYLTLAPLAEPDQSQCLHQASGTSCLFGTSPQLLLAAVQVAASRSKSH